MLLNPIKRNIDHIIIGGGSGGIACANRLGELGRQVVLFDYVTPSETRGSKWGFGGTCVNVGCIPKKLFHDAASMVLESREKAAAFGMKPMEMRDWNGLRDTIQHHVKLLSFNYRSNLHPNVRLISSHAKLINQNTVSYSEMDFLSGKTVEQTSTAAHSVVLAGGGRPVVPSHVSGAQEFGITSDDIFSLPQDPGKVLCVGGSYVALEVAGFLASLGYDTSLAVRSSILRSDVFDRDCANRVLQLLTHRAGCKVLPKTSPESIRKIDNGKLLVRFTVDGGDILEDIYDTVFFGTGRQSDISGISQDIRVSKNGKVSVNKQTLETSLKRVYAIGDIADTGLPELTPVAVRQGELLADFLVSNSSLGDMEMKSMMIPSTVFTPTEYGRAGLSEEAARIKYGGDHDVESYLMEWKSLDSAAAGSAENDCFAKLVCVGPNSEVVGVHFVGPHAGELIQGYGVALAQGVQKDSFLKCLGIHPTNSEALIDMRISKSSGDNYVQSGGCAGGRCG